jgi:hypothetical protein
MGLLSSVYLSVLKFDNSAYSAPLRSRRHKFKSNYAERAETLRARKKDFSGTDSRDPSKQRLRFRQTILQ